MKPISLAPSQVQKQIAALGPWFHNMDIAGLATAPDHFGRLSTCQVGTLLTHDPADLSGKSVLDVGCNAGFYSLEMKRRGARRVVGIDSDEGYLAQARFAASAANVEVEYRRMSVYAGPGSASASTWSSSWVCSTTCVILSWRSSFCMITRSAIRWSFEHVARRFLRCLRYAKIIPSPRAGVR